MMSLSFSGCLDAGEKKDGGQTLDTDRDGYPDDMDDYPNDSNFHEQSSFGNAPKEPSNVTIKQGLYERLTYEEYVESDCKCVYLHMETVERASPPYYEPRLSVEIFKFGDLVHGELIEMDWFGGGYDIWCIEKRIEVNETNWGKWRIEIQNREENLSTTIYNFQIYKIK